MAKWIVGILVVISIGAVLFILNFGAIKTLPTSSSGTVEIQETKTANQPVAATDSQVTENPLPGFKGKVLAGEIPYITEFVKSDYDQVKSSDNLVILYFYAKWCPECKKEIPEFYSAFDELSKDSNKYSKVIGFRVNFNDDETDEDEKKLAREYGVAYQHTKVFIKNGERILKSPETWDKQRYLDEINKAL
jgi:thiol-disulfide isomerase/thioredoxin